MSEMTGFEYEVSKEGTVEITKYNGEEKDVVIPSEIDGMPVVCIGEKAFSECEKIVSVVIPEGVTSIECMVFFGCENLVSIALPDTLQSIGAGAFYDCQSLKSVIIPDSVKEVGEKCFENCTGLEEIKLSESMRLINENLFKQCGSLKEITIPARVNSIANFAFYQCTGLVSIVIPFTVGYIGLYAFGRCTNLKSVRINQPRALMENYVFDDCTSLVNLELAGDLFCLYHKNRNIVVGCGSREFIYRVAGFSSETHDKIVAYLRQAFEAGDSKWFKNEDVDSFLKLCVSLDLSDKRKYCRIHAKRTSPLYLHKFIENNDIARIERIIRLGIEFSEDDARAILDKLLEEKNKNAEMIAHMIDYLNKHYGNSIDLNEFSLD